MTLIDPDLNFKVAIFFHIEYLIDDTKWEQFTIERQ